MEGQLIFRIFVDISSYSIGVFSFAEFYNLFSFFHGCAFIFHIWLGFIKSLFHEMSMIISTIIINTIIIIIYKITFSLSFSIFCDSNKILIKSFNNSLLISNFSTFSI